VETIRLKYADIRNDVFIGVLNRLIPARLPFPVTQKLLMLVQEVNNHRTYAQVMIDKIFEELGEEIVEEGKPSHRAIKKEHETVANERFSACMQLDFDSKIEKFDKVMFQRFELSVNELLAIEPLLHGGLTKPLPAQRVSSEQPLSAV